MAALTPLQWLGVAMLVVGAIWWLAPRSLAAIRSWWPTTPSPAVDPAAALADRMARLAQLQSDLEARGHQEQAALAGEWYCLLRDPIQQEAPSP